MVAAAWLTLCREKQYKDRLSSWNVRKNIKAKEVNIMVRKQEKRATRGKKTVFRLAGQKVDTKRIARFQRRHGASAGSNDVRLLDSHPAEHPRDRESPEPCRFRDSYAWAVANVNSNPV